MKCREEFKFETLEGPIKCLSVPRSSEFLIGAFFFNSLVLLVLICVLLRITAAASCLASGVEMHITSRDRIEKNTLNSEVSTEHYESFIVLYFEWLSRCFYTFILNVILNQFIFLCTIRIRVCSKICYRI